MLALSPQAACHGNHAAGAAMTVVLLAGQQQGDPLMGYAAEPSRCQKEGPVRRWSASLLSLLISCCASQAQAILTLREDVISDDLGERHRKYTTSIKTKRAYLSANKKKAPISPLRSMTRARAA